MHSEEELKERYWLIEMSFNAGLTVERHWLIEMSLMQV